MKNVKTFSKTIKLNNNNYRMVVTVKFNDEYGNKHNTFSITADIKTRRNIIMCGCLPDEIKTYFPELAHAIKWHLWSTDGAMYHIENGLYWYKEKGLNALKEYVNCENLTDSEATKEGLLNRLPEAIKEFENVIVGLGLEYTIEPIR